MSTRASIVLKDNDKEINLWCRSDGYIKSDNGYGLGVDILKSVNQLLSLNNKRLTKKTDINILNLANLLIFNKEKEALEFFKKNKHDSYWGSTLSILPSFDNKANHSFIYTLCDSKIHIEGYNRTKSEWLWNDNLFDGTYEEFQSFLKEYKECYE